MSLNHPFTPAFADVVEAIERSVLSAAEYLVAEMLSGRKPEVWVKPDHTLVMNLDLECQRRVLQQLSSSHPVVAEEDEASHRLVHGGGTYFLVDPLDGTTSCRRFMGERDGHVGYGPLVGFVHEDRLTAACFYSAPHQKLFTAVRGEGTYVSIMDFASDSVPSNRTRLQVTPCAALNQAGVLFYLGTQGEARVMQLLRNKNAIENMYRFGGFANDCVRLAQGYEQASVQFSVKPWDLSAALLSAEAGLEVWADPLGRRVELKDWKIEMNNPLICVQPSIRAELFEVLEQLPA